MFLLIAPQCANAAKPVVRGVTVGDNAVKLLPTGEAFYTELVEAVDSARDFICMEYYSIGTDSVSTLFLDHLAAKQAQGVKVYAIIDGRGSFKRVHPMDEATLKRYKEKGLDIAIFNKKNVSDPLPRDHRKLTIIDGHTAFAGGMNIHDVNIYGSPDFGRVYDMSMRIDGPAAEALIVPFLEVWNSESCREKINITPKTPAGKEGNIVIEILPTVGGYKTDMTVRDNYIRLIDSAQSSLRIVNGYFMPSPPIRRALIRAAERGVKVELLFGSETDLPKILHDKPFKVAKRLAKHDNIEYHIMPGGFFHEKAMSIDGVAVMIGSTNLDLLSRRINNEISEIIYDPEVTRLFNEIYDEYYAR